MIWFIDSISVPLLLFVPVLSIKMSDTEARRQVDAIRVVMVNKEGVDAASASIGDKLANVQPGGFVSIDSEFSGLGRDKDLSHDNLQTRYAAIRRLANTRAIFSVGISIFNPRQPLKKLDGADDDMGEQIEESPIMPIFDVSTYDLLTSCQSIYEMSPNSGEFLTVHGFDFNRMFREGIPYDRASSVPVEKSVPTTDSIPAPSCPHPSAQLPWRWGKLPRGLLWRIGHYNIPIVVHNGLFDLIFLYAAFQAPLPESLNDFVSALLDCVPAGFWDTKVIATSTSQRNSFLAYLFAKSVLSSSIHVHSATNLPAANITNPAEPKLLTAPDILCALFSFRGFCPRGTACPFAHDAFKVVEEEQKGLDAKDANEAYKRHRAQSKSWKRLKDDAKNSSSKQSKKQRKKLQQAASVGIVSAGDLSMPPTAIATSMFATPEIVHATETAPATADDMTEGVFEENGSIHKDHNNNNSMELVDKGENFARAEDAAVTNGCVVPSSNAAHCAGWDAFCTGYIFAVYQATLSAETLKKHHNYIALSKKLSDLLLRRSEYADLDNTVEQPVSSSIPKPEASENTCTSLQ